MKTQPFKIQHLYKEDLEGIKYPNLDTKRAIIDGAIIDKINELVDEVERMKADIDDLKIRGR